MIAKGKDNILFSKTIETSLSDPEFVKCFAVSMTRRNVSCHEVKMVPIIRQTTGARHVEKDETKEDFREDILNSLLLESN